MDSDRRGDRMSSMPLLNMDGNKESDGSANVDPSWSDQELEDFSQDPLEGVLRSVLHRPRAITRLNCVLSSIFFSASSMLVGFLVAYLAFFVLYPPLCGPNRTLHRPQKDGDISRRIIEDVNPENIRKVLLNLTSKPHIGGSQRSLDLANYLKDTWIQNGVPQVKLVPYEVLLSYADSEKPNRIQVKSISKDNIVVDISAAQIPLHSPEESDPTATYTFCAYSPSGEASGEPVYVNFGQEDDFKWLLNHNISIENKIVIARYGTTFRGNVVHNAELHGARGVILFSDPHEYATKGRNHVYPNDVWLPGSGTQSGTVLLSNGDPTTPGYPSVAGAYRLTDLPLPKIPVQPIGYDDAEKILKLMAGVDSPDSWKGNLNVSYKIGPGFTNKVLKVTMDSKNHEKRTKIYNVIGTIPGSEEPDRYVLIGNHRDAWIFGGLDPNSGTAIMTELTRVFGQLINDGWKPRRTIIFCSWGAEEHGLIGSTEWVEENAKVLAERAVAYLNVDVAVEGNYTFRSLSTPSLYDVLYATAKQVPNPNPTEVADGRSTVYDTWLHTSNNLPVPSFGHLGSGSDFASFIFEAGVPVSDFMYKADEKTYPVGNPLYHSLYETFYAVDVLLDPGFKYHVAIAQLWGETARSLADSPLLPISVPTYSKELQKEFETFKKQYASLLNEHRFSLEYLEAAIRNFTAASNSFNSSLASLTKNDPLELRIINDKMMQVERAFIMPEGLPLTPSFKHVLMSSSDTDGYSGQFFPGLVNLLRKIQSSDNSVNYVEMFKKHLAVVTYYVQSAASILGQSI